MEEKKKTWWKLWEIIGSWKLKWTIVYLNIIFQFKKYIWHNIWYFSIGLLKLYL